MTAAEAERCRPDLPPAETAGAVASINEAQSVIPGWENGLMTKSEKRLYRLLKHDLGEAISRTKHGTWMTTSNLPHEIRLHTQSGLALVRVSAGMVVGTKASKRLLAEMNELNTARAFSRRILVDGKVLIVAEMPVESLRTGDLEQLVSMILCLARLDAPMLAEHGGRPVTDPPPELAPNFKTTLNSWCDVLQASGTATARELSVWLDGLVGCNCSIDHDEKSVFVVMEGTGIGSVYPCTLEDLRSAAEDRQAQVEVEDE